MDFVGYVFFRLALAIFYVIPMGMLYKIADGVAWMLRVVLKYRLNVVQANLLKAFPEKDNREIQKIVKQVYQNLADIFVESLKGMTMDWSASKPFYIFTNPEIVEAYTKQNIPTIHSATHCANWEWATFSYTLFCKGRIVGFYKPLSNKLINAYVLRVRSSTRLILADIKHTPDHFTDNLAIDNNVSFVLLSDQSPTSKKSIWVNFFGIDTAFLHGAEFYALKYNFPIFFVHTKRTKRGWYELTFELISENPTQEPENYITERYAALLEKDIRDNPSDWLWTHKRWKMSR